MNMTVKEKSFLEKFVDWVMELPNWIGIWFIIPVLVLWIIALVINKARGQ